MTNKYLEKIADITTNGYTYEGLPKSTFNLADSHAERLALRVDDMAGRDARLGHLTGVTVGGAGIGGIIGALAANAGSRVPVALAGGLGGALIGNIVGRYNPIAKRLYNEGYAESEARTLQERAQDWTDWTLEGLQNVYPSRGDYGDDDIISLPIDERGSVLNIRPSVLQVMRERAMEEARADAVRLAAGTGLHGMDAARDKSSGSAALAAAAAAGGLLRAGDIRNIQNNPDVSKYQRELVESIRSEMLYK